MTLLHTPRRFYLYQGPADLRRSFDGLCGLVRRHLEQDPLSGDVFVFINRAGTHVKLLVFEGDGFAIYYKRLEAGTFERPRLSGDGQVSWPLLNCVLEGVELESVRYRRRYHPAPRAA